MNLALRCSLLLVATLALTATAEATYRDRFSLGGGVIIYNSPSQTDFEISAEGEHRLRRWIGIGGTVNYVFSTPATTIFGVPEVFLHPFKGDWFVSSSPIFEIRSGTDTQIGVRLGTRVLIPLKVFVLVPSFAVDFIDSSQQYIAGIGIGF